jgi:hypothetical protein
LTFVAVVKLITISEYLTPFSSTGQTVSGVMKLKANEHFSYDITMTLTIDGSEVTNTSDINLKDQQYSYLNAASSTVA